VTEECIRHHPCDHRHFASESCRFLRPAVTAVSWTVREKLIVYEDLAWSAISPQEYARIVAELESNAAIFTLQTSSWGRSSRNCGFGTSPFLTFKRSIEIAGRKGAHGMRSTVKP
jgi:hypothetical protein